VGDLVGTNLVKVFPGGARALDGVSFRAREGRVLTLLGPSGCGKSTLLRIVAGLERATSGSLELDGEPIDPRPPGRRDVGFVFQNYALYPHLTVARNLGLALEVRRVPADERRRRVRETAARHLLERRPAQLSGGQQQRVALGRALVRRPRLMLLDEPLSNLDALLRETMRAELASLFQREGTTVLYVTHDQSEAMSLSHEVAVLRGGRVLQCAPPLELYARPADLFVATFVGSPRMSVLHGRRDGGQFVSGRVRLSLPRDLPGGGTLAAAIRPEHVEIVGHADATDAFEARRLVIEPVGAQVLLTLQVDGETIRALAPPRDWPERITLRWPPAHVHWFDATSGRRLEPGTGEGS
jgi:multiple sugar transport system ATP-binding protein